MPLVSTYLLPHGGIIVPGLEPNRNAAADHLHQLMQQVGEEIQQDEIDLIFLTSPHGYTHTSDILIYYHNLFEGWRLYRDSANSGIDRFQWSGNTEVSGILNQLFNQANIRASPFIQGDSDYPLKLSWSETIPLSYLPTKKAPQVIIFSLPMNIGEQNEAGEYPAKLELDKIGRLLAGLAESPMFANIKVSIIISGDLSHKHDANHPFGFDENASIFDSLVSEWIQNPQQSTLDKLYELQESAESCGLYGINILHGILNFFPDDTIKLLHSHYELPSYFGMTVASWKNTFTPIKFDVVP